MAGEFQSFITLMEEGRQRCPQSQCNREDVKNWHINNCLDLTGQISQANPPPNLSQGEEQEVTIPP